MSRAGEPAELSPELLLRAYAAGIFPMSEAQDDDRVFWVDPEARGILPLDAYHIPRSLKKTVRKGLFEARFDTAFIDVLDLCAEAAPQRENTWINRPIRNAVIRLHEMGFAHSVESWHDGELVGGLYGVALGSTFFGESMFSRRTNASKVALVNLLALLRLGHFQLLDTQFVTDHLATFGTMEISSDEYLIRLEEALKYQSLFHNNIADAQLAIAVERVLADSKKP
jgi:leucyl/phenylalanyl-tRNA---protein transferase